MRNSIYDQENSEPFTEEDGSAEWRWRWCHVKAKNWGERQSYLSYDITVSSYVLLVAVT